MKDHPLHLDPERLRPVIKEGQHIKQDPSKDAQGTGFWTGIYNPDEPYSDQAGVEVVKYFEVAPEEEVTIKSDLYLDLEKAGRKKPYGHKAYTRIDPRTGKAVRVKAKNVKITHEEDEEALKKQEFQNFMKVLEHYEGSFDFIKADGDLTLALMTPKEMTSMIGHMTGGGTVAGVYRPHEKTMIVGYNRSEWNSFGHEFGHYLDHKLGEAHEQRDEFYTTKTIPVLHGEIDKRFVFYASHNTKSATASFVGDLMKGPVFKKRIEDMKRAVDDPYASYSNGERIRTAIRYLTTPTEVFARFFNEYLHFKFSEAGLLDQAPAGLTYGHTGEWSNDANFQELVKTLEEMLHHYGIKWKTKPKKPKPTSKTKLKE